MYLGERRKSLKPEKLFMPMGERYEAVAVPDILRVKDNRTIRIKHPAHLGEDGTQALSKAPESPLHLRKIPLLLTRLSQVHLRFTVEKRRAREHEAYASVSHE